MPKKKKTELADEEFDIFIANCTQLKYMMIKVITEGLVTSGRKKEDGKGYSYITDWSREYMKRAFNAELGGDSVNIAFAIRDILDKLEIPHDFGQIR